MAKSLVLRLEGPLQAWGDQSRAKERGTAHYPTNSGVMGLLGAALGIPRGGDFSELQSLKMFVRVDKPGRIHVDFQSMAYRKDAPIQHPSTLRNPDQKEFLKNRSDNRIFTKSYLAEASFLVVLEGEDAIVDKCAEALRHPVHFLALGRRNCPPTGPILQGVHSEPAETILQTVEVPEREKVLVVRTANEGESGHVAHDVLVSNKTSRRLFAPRQVIESHMEFPKTPDADHDPFDMLTDIEGTNL